MLNADGKKSTINSPQNIKALQLMVDGIKSGAAPKAVTTYMEPETDQAWTSGKYGYMRNWTYAYAADNKSPSKVEGKYKVAPLPTFEGGGKAGILGGHNSVISVYTKNPGLALKFADFYASPAFQKKLAAEVLAGGGHPGHLQRGRRQEGDPVRAGAPAGAQPGQGAPGVAGLSADLAGDLQERQRRARRSRRARRTP